MLSEERQTDGRTHEEPTLQNGFRIMREGPQNSRPPSLHCVRGPRPLVSRNYISESNLDYYHCLTIGHHLGPARLLLPAVVSLPRAAVQQKKKKQEEANGLRLFLLRVGTQVRTSLKINTHVWFDSHIIHTKNATASIENLRTDLRGHRALWRQPLFKQISIRRVNKTRIGGVRAHFRWKDVSSCCSIS